MVTRRQKKKIVKEFIETRNWDGLTSMAEDEGSILKTLKLMLFSPDKLFQWKAVEAMWRDALDTMKRIDLQVRHLGWIRTDDIAIHLVEELPPGAPGQTAPPVYATNIYRKRDGHWRIIWHQNSPLPPPPTGPESGAFPHLP